MEKNGDNLPKEENAVGSDPQKRKKRIIVRVCAAAIALAVAVAMFFAGFACGGGGFDKQERSLLWMLDAVQKNYREEVSREELFDRMYDALELDRFCSHYTPEELADEISASRGENTGYGIAITETESGVRVSRVIQNSPAELAGLAKGMYIAACGEGGRPQSNSEVISYLDGVTEGAATLACGFLADGSDARVFTVQRAAYRAAYCFYADSEGTFRFRGDSNVVLTQTGEGLEGIPADTAYLALTQFEGKADEEFEACLLKMRERGRKNLILDLRGNGGGYLSLLCNISSHLLRNGQGRAPLVAQARFRNGEVQNYTAAKNDFSDYFAKDAVIRVLADENSASASEALIGALIDYGTCSFGDIYLRKGEGTARTYGKGVMQSRFTAPDGNAMMLTVADICWPQGRCIHGKGITEEDGAVPVSAPLFPAETDEFLERVLAAIG